MDNRNGVAEGSDLVQTNRDALYDASNAASRTGKGQRFRRLVDAPTAPCDD